MAAHLKQQLQESNRTSPIRACQWPFKLNGSVPAAGDEAHRNFYNQSKWITWPAEMHGRESQVRD